MKIKLIIILFIILKINLFSKEPNQFEGLIEYKVTSKIFPNKLFNLSKTITDSIQNEIENGNMEEVPTRILFYINKKGDYRVENYNNKFINYFIYKSSINKFYSPLDDSLFLEGNGNENRFNINKEKIPNIVVVDTNFKFNSNLCKNVKITWDNGYKIEYIYSESNFKVNPDNFINNNYNNFCDYVKIAKSLPIIIKLFEPNIISTVQELVSYKEYDLNDSLFYVDSSKVKKMDDFLGDFELTEDDKKEMQDFVSKMTAKNNNEIDSLETEFENETELTEDKIEIIDIAIQKLNIELTRDAQKGIITKEHLEKCLKLLKDFGDENRGIIESQDILEGDEELFIKLLDKLKEIINSTTEE